MSKMTAKVFRAGNSQALRLPVALALSAKTYEITPIPDGFMFTVPAAKARRIKSLRKLRVLPPMQEDWARP
jgi:virulence-associated protein VagC